MTFNQFIKTYLYRFFGASLISMILTIVCCDIFHIKIALPLLILLVIFENAIVCAFDINKKSPVPYAIIGAFFVVVLFILLRNGILKDFHFSSYLEWIDTMRVNEPDPDAIPDPTIPTVLYTLLSLFLLFLCSIPFYLLNKAKIGRCLLAVAMIVSIAGMIFVGVDINKVASGCTYGYLFMVLIEIACALSHRGENKSAVDMTTFLLPFVFVFIIGICLLPSKKQPLQFTLIKSAWNKMVECGYTIADNISDLFHSSSTAGFSLSFSGFSDSAELGNGVNGNDTVAIKVNDLTRKRTNIYLTGNRKNEFTGDGWIDTTTQDEILSPYSDMALDENELVNTVASSFETFQAQDVMTCRSFMITYEKLKTKTLFYPLNTVNIESYDRMPKYTISPEGVKLKKSSKYHGSYRVDCFELNLGSKATEQFLIDNTKEEKVDATYDSQYAKQIVQVYFKKNIIPVIEHVNDVIQHRREVIREQYMKLPDNISQDIIQLSQDITKDADSGYEKMRLIEAYLNQYKYTRHPKQPQNGEDRIEYFLFDSKEGYCTYFATAMALMGRCIGIPTRYVQGYCMKQDNSVSSYQVRGNNAHAWMEAYFEGIGWVPFEPTSGYTELMYKSKLFDEERMNAGTYADTMEAYWKAMAEAKNREQHPVTEQVVMKDHSNRQVYRILLMTLLSIVVLAILLVSMYLMIVLIHCRKLYRDANQEDKLYIILKRIQLLIVKLGLSDITNRTIQQLFEQIQEVEEMKEAKPLETANLFMKLRYSRQNLSQEEIGEIQRFYERFVEYAKEHKRKLSYCVLSVKLTKICR